MSPRSSSLVLLLSDPVEKAAQFGDFSVIRCTYFEEGGDERHGTIAKNPPEHSLDQSARRRGGLLRRCVDECSSGIRLPAGYESSVLEAAQQSHDRGVAERTVGSESGSNGGGFGLAVLLQHRQDLQLRLRQKVFGIAGSGTAAYHVDSSQYT